MLRDATGRWGWNDLGRVLSEGELECGGRPEFDDEDYAEGGGAVPEFDGRKGCRGFGGYSDWGWAEAGERGRGED